MKTRVFHVEHSPVLGSVLFLLLAGCCTSEVDLTETEGRESDQVASLIVHLHDDNLQSADREPVHVRAIVIDQVAIPISTTIIRLSPGNHRIAADFEECIHWPRSWFRGPRRPHVNQTGITLDAKGGSTTTLRFVATWNSGPSVNLRILP